MSTLRFNRPEDASNAKKKPAAPRNSKPWVSDFSEPSVDDEEPKQDEEEASHSRTSRKVVKALQPQEGGPNSKLASSVQDMPSSAHHLGYGISISLPHSQPARAPTSQKRGPGGRGSVNSAAAMEAELDGLHNENVMLRERVALLEGLLAAEAPSSGGVDQRRVRLIKAQNMQLERQIDLASRFVDGSGALLTEVEAVLRDLRGRASSQLRCLNESAERAGRAPFSDAPVEPDILDKRPGGEAAKPLAQAPSINSGAGSRPDHKGAVARRSSFVTTSSGASAGVSGGSSSSGGGGGTDASARGARGKEAGRSIRGGSSSAAAIPRERASDSATSVASESQAVASRHDGGAVGAEGRKPAGSLGPAFLTSLEEWADASLKRLQRFHWQQDFRQGGASGDMWGGRDGGKGGPMGVAAGSRNIWQPFVAVGGNAFLAECEQSSGRGEAGLAPELSAIFHGDSSILNASKVHELDTQLATLAPELASLSMKLSHLAMPLMLPEVDADITSDLSRVSAMLSSVASAVADLQPLVPGRVSLFGKTARQVAAEPLQAVHTAARITSEQVGASPGEGPVAAGPGAYRQAAAAHESTVHLTGASASRDVATAGALVPQLGQMRLTGDRPPSARLTASTSTVPDAHAMGGAAALGQLVSSAAAGPGGGDPGSLPPASSLAPRELAPLPSAKQLLAALPPFSRDKVEGAKWIRALLELARARESLLLADFAVVARELDYFRDCLAAQSQHVTSFLRAATQAFESTLAARAEASHALSEVLSALRQLQTDTTDASLKNLVGVLQVLAPSLSKAQGLLSPRDGPSADGENRTALQAPNGSMGMMMARLKDLAEENRQHLHSLREQALHYEVDYLRTASQLPV
eukprot:jgi/Mesvir1/28951/Mv17729-RA.1